MDKGLQKLHSFRLKLLSFRATKMNLESRIVDDVLQVRGNPSTITAFDIMNSYATLREIVDTAGADEIISYLKMPTLPAGQTLKSSVLIAEQSLSKEKFEALMNTVIEIRI